MSHRTLKNWIWLTILFRVYTTTSFSPIHSIDYERTPDIAFDSHNINIKNMRATRRRCPEVFGETSRANHESPVLRCFFHKRRFEISDRLYPLRVDPQPRLAVCSLSSPCARLCCRSWCYGRPRDDPVCLASVQDCLAHRPLRHCPDQRSQPLGSFRFSDNSRTGYAARELKSAMIQGVRVNFIGFPSRDAIRMVPIHRTRLG